MRDAFKLPMRADSGSGARARQLGSSRVGVSTKRLLEVFLVTLYRRATAAEHATPTPLREIAKELVLSEGLAEKIAEFLESQGVIDYDDQAVDITIPGMIRAEEIMRRAIKEVAGAGHSEADGQPKVARHHREALRRRTPLQEH
jgi:hypothetical protein